ncbi:hypothetical protein LHJ74_09120 [Streptomyces sp. N2-109]|uniref:Integral membrane protein n=1 Tax=Streptomyces gossypii TaxID=2883101 RepID=A0ABT2JQB5_9ACTN|nr:hypothetical protein [Streptomyces gossypii]MCT2590070.1 hypothetical protein [Streptomyces gossypii]
MSDTQRPDGPEETGEQGLPGLPGLPGEEGPDADRPLPEPIRFFGTTWVDHTGGYALRRIGLGLGSLLLAVVGAYALRLAYEGVAIAELGDWARLLMILAFAICSSIGFSRTLTGFKRRPETEEDAARERSMRSFLLVGFVGVLLAYAVRTLIEAPGEKLHRTEHEAALKSHERRRTARTGNPAKRKRKPKRKPRN